jgi:ankyrin repeat protein
MCSAGFFLLTLIESSMDELSKSQKVALHEAYKRGDLEAVRAALGSPDNFPNCPGPVGVGSIVLEYAIYHSPLPFVRTLLELGADPNYESPGGFPSLIATLSTDRPDRIEILELLLSRGADIQQRGLNGYTPLHYAANLNDCRAVELLVARGADLQAKTNVDDFTTPLEEAKMLGRAEATRLLRKLSGAGPEK